MADVTIQDSIKSLLSTADILPTNISFDTAQQCKATFLLTQLWTFTPEVKDTIEHAITAQVTVLSEAELNDFKLKNLESLEKATMVSKPFCNALEKMTPKEIFAMGNKINRLSSRHARGLCVCPDCKGNEKVNCPNCAGFGVILCPSCQGKEGGCYRCNKTGYITCESCKGQKKVPCLRCNSKGKVEVDTEVFINASSMANIEIEYENTNDCFKIPPVKVDRACYHDVMESVQFKLANAEYLENGTFAVTLKGETTIDYIKFCISGISRIFNFWTCSEKKTPLFIPKILDIHYSLFKTKLADAAVGSTAGNMNNKVALIQELSNDKLFSTLLASYETDYEAITKNLKSDTTLMETYANKLFTVKSRLESIVAVRKEELSRGLQRKLLGATRGLMSDSFAQDCCMSLVQFMTNLKYRPKLNERLWHIASLVMWGLTIFVVCMLHTKSTVISTLIISLLVCFGVSYLGTKNLYLYETMMRTRFFDRAVKFTDINYDLIRAFILICGVSLIEIGGFYIS